uniref:DNA replication licensing factor MCM2 n=1 Tax=Tetraselmis sp. GSL018 TaxID=582737 RepID=A0A061RCL3_9CHLO|mmetsp:Transcript_10872/g.25825  ORF Transcript_10872/g.25825 Transcript_10872/m.25825 type:complete len:868 (+) Transcript_10872:191-2794(+)
MSQSNISDLPPETQLEDEFDDERPEDDGADGPEIAHSDDEGEDLLEGMERDYRPNAELDRYEDVGMDEDVEDVSEVERFAQRQAAEAEMDRRDRRRARIPAAFEDDDDEQPIRRRRLDRAQEAGDYDDEAPCEINIEEYRGSLREWVVTEPVTREIKRRFLRFLRSFTDDSGDVIYAHRTTEMCRANKQSLEVDFLHLCHAQGEALLAIWVVDCPRQILPIFHEAATTFALELFPQYDEIHERNSICVRITNLPELESLRGIRQNHLDSLVQVAGVVTRRTGVFPQLQMVVYDCLKCAYKNGPFVQTQQQEVKPMSCSNCQSKGPFSVNVQETVYRNYQKITLQESPGTVPAGRLPRSKDVILLHDLIDVARPGEQIQVTGIYTHTYDMSLNVKNGFPVFSTVIEANHVSKKEDQFSMYKLTDEDRQEIRRLGETPDIGERIAASIAPSIYGHEMIKTFIALAMFGGQEKMAKGTHRLRGDINVLLLGDPGTAKSQFLKYVENTAKRAVFTTGKGASAVGLTASVHRDPITREWTLEGGALVLADRGICLIDEFDKMNDQDRVSIHEAMEQQSISVSKAGIVTQLQARCSVIAAANPINGRYDSSMTFTENIELTDPILSRFDCLAVIKDTVDPDTDERLAEFVVNSHHCSHPDAADQEGRAGSGGVAVAAGKEPLPQELLRKYVAYAKECCHPKLQHGDYDKITKVYAALRRESEYSQGMPIAVRHLESIIRMSEAHAKMHLREYVKDDDINVAIRCMLESFISTQKLSVQKAMRRRFSRFITVKSDFNELALHTLRQMVRDALQLERLQGSAGSTDDQIRVKYKSFAEKAKELGIADLQPFMSSTLFKESGFAYDSESGVILHSR